jgi:hypothetical protein
LQKASLVVKVEKLWSFVYRKSEITNGSIFVSFAKGVLAKRKGIKVNWARYVTQAWEKGGKGHKNEKNYK